jgi:hypothetical protein
MVPPNRKQADDESKAGDRSGVYGRRAGGLCDIACDELQRSVERRIRVSDDHLAGVSAVQRLRAVGASLLRDRRALRKQSSGRHRILGKAN